MLVVYAANAVPMGLLLWETFLNISQLDPLWYLELKLKNCMMPLERLCTSMSYCLITLLWYNSAYAFRSGNDDIHQVSVKMDRRVKFLYIVPQFSLLFHAICVCSKWHSSFPGFVDWVLFVHLSGGIREMIKVQFKSGIRMRVVGLCHWLAGLCLGLEMLCHGLAKLHHGLLTDIVSGLVVLCHSAYT